MTNVDVQFTPAGEGYKHATLSVNGRVKATFAYANYGNYRDYFAAVVKTRNMLERNAI